VSGWVGRRTEERLQDRRAKVSGSVRTPHGARRRFGERCNDRSRGPAHGGGRGGVEHAALELPSAESWCQAWFADGNLFSTQGSLVKGGSTRHPEAERSRAQVFALTSLPVESQQSRVRFPRSAFGSQEFPERETERPSL
jgi:hypothetical protein